MSAEPILCLGCGEGVAGLDAPCPRCLPGTRVIGGYLLRDLLGRGASGEVYDAVESGTGRRVALKLLHPVQERDVRRFEREVAALERLDHPGVVRVVSRGIDRHPYLALERIVGESLQDRLERAGPLAPGEAARVCEQVALALAHLHAQGVVHRDVKPANVLLEEETGRVVLVDFGLAFYTASPLLTAPGSLLGTLHFMAPEQIRSRERCTPSADVYALGATLYACLTGQPPFAHCVGLEALVATVDVPAPPPSRVAPQVPASLDAICARALRKRVEARYSSAETLAAALARWDQPLAGRESPSERSYALADPDATDVVLWYTLAVTAAPLALLLVLVAGLNPLTSVCTGGGAVLLGFCVFSSGRVFRLIPALGQRLGPERTRALWAYVGTLAILAGLVSRVLL